MDYGVFLAMRAAADDPASAPVRRGEEEAHYRRVKTFAHQRWRFARRTNWLLIGMVLPLLASNVFLSIGFKSLFPLVRHEPIYFGVMEDGSIDTAISKRDLTETEREAATKASAWTYVKMCESYSYADAQYRYDACRHMSDTPVRDAFEAKWFLPNGKDAPESPQKMFGKNGQIDVAKIGKPVFVRDNVIQVRFKKITRLYDLPAPPPSSCTPPSCTTWTATIDFTLLDRMPNGTQDDNGLKFYVMRYKLDEGAS